MLAGTVGDPVNPPAEGDKASGAIRAEQIRLAGDAAQLSTLDCVLAGTVSDTIFEGERMVYEVACAAIGDEVIRVF
ncbi:TOBE domain-containing protein, partial [Mesorhizobium sp.]|uniref:TOBE domain-containing protein n=1 Tax=Mesorhizobium sp. TaxID=1871066 RepID=UPI0025DC1882